MFLEELDSNEREFWNQGDKYVEKLVTSREVTNLPEGD